METPFAVTSSQNPYRQFPITLAPREILNVFYAFDVFRILAIVNEDDVVYRFGQSGAETNIVGAGIGIKLNEAVNVLTLRNTSSVNTVTMTIALAIGNINDDRLNTVGAITISDIDVPAIFDAKPDITLVANTTTLLMGAVAVRREAFISNYSLTDTLSIGDSGLDATHSGILIPPRGTLILATSAQIYGRSTGTPLVGTTELRLI